MLSLLKKIFKSGSAGADRPGASETRRDEGDVAVGANMSDAERPLSESADRLLAAGNYDDAIREYDRLIRDYPDNVELIKKKGNVYFSRGQLDEAASVYQSALAVEPENYAVNYNYANTLLRQGNLDEALQACDRALSSRPDCVDTICMIGNIFMESKRFPEAEEKYRSAIKYEPNNPFIKYNLANALLQEEKYVDAENVLKSAVDILEKKRGGDDFSEKHLSILAKSCCLMGVIFSRREQVEQADLFFSKCMEINPEDADSLVNMADAMFASKRYDRGVSYVNKVLELYPDHLPAIIKKVSFLEKLNQLDEAADLLERGRRLAPDHIEVKLKKLLLIMRSGDYEEAANFISAISAAEVDELTPSMKVSYYHDCGQVFDRVNDADRAFDYFTRANREKRKTYEMEALAGNELTYIRMINNCLEQSKKGWDTQHDLSEVDEAELSPVFFMGFPRSGTTLIGKILEAHPDINVLEETDAIEELIFRDIKSVDDYVDFVLGLTPDDIVRLRKDYFDHVRRYIDIKEGNILVDKLPLYTVHMAFIRILFPKAKFVFAVRHGCDVILSNFMQNYALNIAMVNFLDLHSSAVMYAKVMELYAAYNRVLAPELHEIRYEDVVNDFDKTVNALLQFIGVPWDDRVSKFNKLKKKSELITPSYAAVTSEIYSHAKFRWERYRHYMEDEIAMIEPWLERFGYGSSHRQDDKPDI